MDGVRCLIQGQYPASDFINLSPPTFHHQLMYPHESTGNLRSGNWNNVTRECTLQAAYRSCVKSEIPRCVVCCLPFRVVDKSTKCSRCGLNMHLTSQDCSKGDLMTESYCSERCQSMTGTSAFAVAIVVKGELLRGPNELLIIPFKWVMVKLAKLMRRK